MLRRLKSINLSYRMRSLFNFNRRFVVGLILFLLGLILIPLISINIIVRQTYQEKINAAAQYSDVEDSRIAVVFGAGLNQNGNEPGVILKDRLDSAVELYKLGKIQKIIVSGDSRDENHNETLVMYSYLINAGVSSFDLEADSAGINTYDSCYRAKEVFGVTKAILITQRFHLYRALFTCESLGIEVHGVASDKSLYDGRFYNNLREAFALVNTFYKLFISPPEVAIEDKIVI